MEWKLGIFVCLEGKQPSFCRQFLFLSLTRIVLAEHEKLSLKI